MKSQFASLQNFDQISLQQLNSKAALLERSDQKYVLNSQQIDDLLAFCLPDFEVLTIENKQSFGYRSQYFDSENLQTFKDHNQGKRNRIKVRRRIYLDANNLSFFEVKLKGLRNKTHKYRLKIDANSAENLASNELEFLQTKHDLHYQTSWQTELFSSVTVDYQRITLVAKHGAERITLDREIEFFDTQTNFALPTEKWIVEVKTANGRSPINRYLLQQNIRPAGRCSKYSMGISLLKYPKNNRFKPVMKQKFGITNE